LLNREDKYKKEVTEEVSGACLIQSKKTQ